MTKSSYSERCHAGGLRVGGGRILRQDPAPMPGGPADRVARPLEGGLPARIDPTHRAGVALGRDPDPRGDRLRLVERVRRQMGKLRIARLFEEVFIQSRDLEPYKRMPPCSTIAL